MRRHSDLWVVAPELAEDLPLDGGDATNGARAGASEMSSSHSATFDARRRHRATSTRKVIDCRREPPPAREGGEAPHGGGGERQENSTVMLIWGPRNSASGLFVRAASREIKNRVRVLMTGGRATASGHSVLKIVGLRRRIQRHPRAR
jgi:hypothetical protein